MGAKSERLTLYTSQRLPVAQMLAAGQTYLVEKRFIREKYGEVAGVFLPAYEWFWAEAGRHIPRPEGAESAVWAYANAQNAGHYDDTACLTLSVPVADALLFDLRDWQRILNALPLGDDAERAAYERQLETQGVRQAADVVASPFYPALKRQLLQSWEALLQNRQAHAGAMLQEAPEAFYVQAGLLKIEPEWVVEGLAGL